MSGPYQFCCGFECGIIGQNASHWQSTGGTAPTVSTGTVRTGQRSMKCDAAAGASYATTWPIAFTTANPPVGRYYVRFEVLPDADTAIIIYGNDPAAGGPTVEFKQSESKLYCGVRAVGGATTTLGATGVSITTDTWYRIDFQLQMNAGSNDVSDAQVDGIALGQATAAGASTLRGDVTIGLLYTCTGTAYFDDFLGSNAGVGDYPVGAGNVYHFIPTADGTHNIAGAGNFRRSLTGVDITNATTDAYLLIDDVPLDSGTPTDFINLIAPLHATDYVECIFGPAPGVPSPVAPPRAVNPIVARAAANTPTNNLRVAINDNGTLADIVNNSVGSTTCVYENIAQQLAPTGGNWILGGGGSGDFNNLRVNCFSSDANPDPYFVSVMIEAEFAPVPVPFEWHRETNTPSIPHNIVAMVESGPRPGKGLN